jgi:peptidoglycan/LPS O-acetylase OafA/YrhL
MRAIAVFAVVTVHAASISGLSGAGLGRFVVHLDAGVAIFFVLAGFLLYRPFIAARAHGPDPPGTALYFRRRALRIIPAYWLLLLVLVLIPGLQVSQGGSVLQYLTISAFTFDSGSGFCDGCVVTQTWSLGVEAAFYLLLPFIVLAGDQLTRKMKTREWLAVQVVFLAALASLALLIQFGVYGGSSPGVIGTTIRFLPWFVAGMLLAVFSAADRDRLLGFRGTATVRLTAALWAGAVVVYLTACLILPESPILLLGIDKFVALILFGLAATLLTAPFVFAEQPTGPIPRFLSSSLMSWLGLISYGVFLWHVAAAEAVRQLWPGIGFAPLLVAMVAITVPVAAASYYLVERPLLRFKYR